MPKADKQFNWGGQDQLCRGVRISWVGDQIQLMCSYACIYSVRVTVE